MALEQRPPTETPASADPRPGRRAARFERILSAAWSIAEEQGLAGVSLREVARRVGLRQPSLYAYIDSKSALRCDVRPGRQVLACSREVLVLFQRSPAGGAGRVLGPAGTSSFTIQPRVSCCSSGPSRDSNPAPPPTRSRRNSWRSIRTCWPLQVLRIQPMSTSSPRSWAVCSLNRKPMSRAVTGGSGTWTPCSRCSSPTLTAESNLL